MKAEFPHVDLPCEALAWTQVTEDILNIYKQPCRLQACIVAVCTEGHMKASINLVDYEIRPNDLVTLLPGTIIQFREKTEKVNLCFAGFSSACIGRIDLIKSIEDIYPILSKQPVIPIPENVAGYLQDNFALLARVSLNESFTMDPELSDISLQTVLSSIHLFYRRYAQKKTYSNRKQEICRDLIHLISKHYKTERRVQFYADQLGVSIQHLSTTVKQETGKNVLATIAHVIIMDAKSKLKSTQMTIQEIAYSLNFPCASFFGKYFKRYAGMTPLEFRNR